MVHPKAKEIIALIENATTHLKYLENALHDGQKGTDDLMDYVNLADQELNSIINLLNSN